MKNGFTLIDANLKKREGKKKLAEIRAIRVKIFSS